jgi:hypothetical protein
MKFSIIIEKQILAALTKQKTNGIWITEFPS